MVAKKSRKKVSDFRQEIANWQRDYEKLNELYVNAMKRADDAEKALAEANATVARLKEVISIDSTRLAKFARALEEKEQESRANALADIRHKNEADLLRGIIVEALNG